MEPLHLPFFAGITAFVICVIVMPMVIRFVTQWGFVVAPRKDRWHQKPTALMGGIGVFFSYTIAIFLFDFHNINFAIYAVCLGMFFIGLYDDIRNVKPLVKLLSQVVVSVVLLYNGYSFGGGLLEWAGIPLTFFWVIGITNAINLLDNMDGLAAGISMIIAVIAGILAIATSQYTIATMAFSLAGATLGFLIYNYNPAKIFMGDCGSLFLGFSLSFLSIAVQGKIGSSSAILVLLVPITLMAIPIMDTTMVTIKRIVAGRRIDQGGRDHTSHRLVALGLTERRAVIILYLISAIWGAVCVLLVKTQVNNLLLCVLLLTIFSGFFAIILSKVKVYDESEEKLSYLRYRGQRSGDHILLRFFLFHKKLIAGIFIDILVVYCAFLIAAASMKIDLREDYFILGLFIFVKLAVFYGFNLYYKMWRYVAIKELSGFFIAALLGSIALYLIFIIWGKNNYSFYFYLMDFLLTFTGVLFARLIYRWLVETLAGHGQFQKRAIIYGAGDSGYLLIKELFHNNKYKLKPVACIDDDRTKHNMFIYGLKVFGDIDTLMHVCEKTKADIVLISTNAIGEEQEGQLRQLLSHKNIELGRFNVGLNLSPSLQTVTS